MKYNVITYLNTATSPCPDKPALIDENYDLFKKRFNKWKYIN